MDLDVERHVRIKAPVALVWAEMDSLDNVLRKSPQLLRYESADQGRRAVVATKLAWGPLRYEVEGTAEVRESVPHQSFSYCVSIPQLSLVYEATIGLGSCGPAETSLEYDGHLELDHKMASRLRGLFCETIEDYAHSLVSRVKARAEQRQLADERLLQ